jgi:hypothetical protein
MQRLLIGSLMRISQISARIPHNHVHERLNSFRFTEMS